MLRVDGRNIKVKIPCIYPDLYYNKVPFINIDWFVDFLFCHKIKYVNLGLLIWLVYFDIVDTLLRFIERNSDSLSRSTLLVI